MPYQPPYDLDEVAFFDAGELERRAAFFKSADPFEDIPPALLSSEHICDYVRVTGMIHPFYPLKSRLKAASYQVRAKRYMRWTDDGEKHVEEVRPGSIHALPPNSITFVQLESTIRLPDYIAMRFHLDGALAQRGLLLGAGPFMDPAAGGDLLVPLHNLTSQSYSLNAEDGVVWIEFAKTSHSEARRPAQRRVFHAADDAKTRASPERDAGKASVDGAVQSSIPVAIRDATGRAEARSARQAKWAAGVLAVIGVLTIAGAVYATMLTLQLHFQQLNADVVAANSLAAAAAKEAAAATQKSELLTRELAESRLALANLQAEIARIREEVKAKPEPAQASPAPPPPARSPPSRPRRPRR